MCGVIIMKIYSIEDAALLVMAARKEAKQYPHLRFGQALFNMLPNEVYAYFTGTKNDFFYWTDEEKVLQVFWTEYVSNETAIEEYTEDDKRTY